MKKQKGITLVALVVTIIVLIILAGISINLLLGENGIITKAKEASRVHQYAQLKEELELEIVNLKIQKTTEGKEFKREDLAELANIGATMESFGIPAEGEYKDYFFEVDENYRVTIVGKLKGEKPTITGEILTTGIVAEGGTVEIKVTASISEGDIQSIEATNGATLKTDTSSTEKVFEVSANGTYYFKTKADNGRSAVVAVIVNTIIEKPEISIQTITDESFKIVVTNNYAEGIVTEYKYYVEGTLKNSGTTNTSYIVENLEANTEYTNIYVEATINGKNLASTTKTGKTTVEQIAQVNKPKVTGTGLVPVTINSDGSLTEVSENDSNWYAYGRTTRKWANAKTTDESLWVWIPRYAYKITYTNLSDKSAGGTIDVVFLKDDTNNDFNGKDVTSSSYVDAKGNTGAYIVHPAFRDGSATGLNNGYANGEWDDEITGIWIAKFEAGYAGTAGDKTSAQDSTVPLSVIYQYNGSTDVDLKTNYYGTRAVGDLIKYPVFQANCPSMNNLGISDAYNLLRSLTASGNPYGLTSNIDSHLVKNSEWGAIAYLTHSKYGRNREEVTINNVSANNTNTIYAVTGYGGATVNASQDTSRTLATLTTFGQTGSWTTSQGQNASSTGNIYGIYDLSGGLLEWTAGYVATTGNYETYGGNLKGESSKYKSKYAGTSTTNQTNYTTSPNPSRIGEAIWETSISGVEGSKTSWNSDYSYFWYTLEPFSIFGGAWGDNSCAGIFAFNRASGYCYCYIGFRPILIAE